MEHRLISEDQHKFVVRHPAGHDITIAKAGLQPAVISKIKKLPPLKMADGGEVPDPQYSDGKDDLQYMRDSILGSPADAEAAHDDAMASLPTTPDDTASAIAPQGMNPSPSVPALGAAPDPSLRGLVGPVAPVGPTEPDQALPPADTTRSPASSASGGPAGSTMADPLKTLQQAQAMQAAGIRGAAKAKGAESDQQAKAYQDYLDQQKALTAQYDQKYKQLDAEGAQFQKAYADGRINPNHIWENTSTGNKILAGLGILLSGLGGGGANGTPNLALESINKQIDRDIDAQKYNIDKNKNLFSMNMDKYRNTQLAENATRLQMNQALQAQVQMAAAKSGSAQAQANAQILLGQLKQQQVPLQMQIAQMQVHNTMAGGGGGQGGLPVNQAPGYVLTDPKTVQVGDRVYQARDPKEAAELRTMQANYKPVVNGLQMLDKLGPSAALPGTAASAQADSIKHALMFKINELYGLKRLSEPDMKALTAEIDNPNSFKQMLTKGVRNSTFKRILDDSMDSAYSTKLPGYRGLSSLSSRGQGFK